MVEGSLGRVRGVGCGGRGASIFVFRCTPVAESSRFDIILQSLSFSFECLSLRQSPVDA